MPDAITLKNLTKEYPGSIKALQGITLSINPGEFFALLGPNGAGKTTLINILAGLTTKTGGEALVLGKDIVREYQEARALLGLVPQEFNLAIFDRVYDTLFFNAGYFGLPRAQRAARIEQLLRDFGLWEKRKAKIRELSSGMKRKVLIARALLHQPQVLILDEPTAGVDVETRWLFWDYFRQLNRNGTTILLTTHYIEEAEELCERIAIINKGEIVALDKKEKMLGLLEQETIIVQLAERLAKVPAILNKFHPLLYNSTLTLEFNPQKDTFTSLLAKLYRTKLNIKKVETRRTTLEDVFLHLTKK
ncbi:MAG: ABC transporter ATP-binding protein [Nanoarchaeota archaeon]|mgnify:FL=1